MKKYVILLAVMSKIAVRLDVLGCACVDMPRGFVEPIQEKKK